MTYFVDTRAFDPYFNIAAEEYFFRNFEENIVFLYINSPSVIIGKHQNVYEEVNLRHIKENNIPLIRRISGGGSVFHDMGNLNFTFISNKREGSQINFREQTKPVMAFLEKYGLEPKLGDKNEIRLGDWKFSGNAEHVFKNRVMHHGTLLFSSHLDKMGAALKPGTGKYISRSVKSNRTNVGLLSPYLPELKDVCALKDALGEFLKESSFGTKNYNLNIEDSAEIKKLLQEKYTSDKWNYAYGPDYVFSNSFLFNKLRVNLELSVKKGLIKDAKISEGSGLERVVNAMINKGHLYEVLFETLSTEGLEADKAVVYNFF